MRDACKSYGQSIYHRLILVEDSLAVAANDIAANGASRLHEQFADRFESVEVTPFDFDTTSDAPRTGHRPNGSRLSADDIRHLPNGRIAVSTVSGPSGAAQILARRAIEPQDLTAGILEATIRNDFVLSPRDFSEFSNLCLLDDRRRELHCQNPLPDGVLEQLDNRSSLSDSEAIDFDHGGQKHIATHWTLFLRPRFRTPSWHVYASQPMDTHLGTANASRNILPAAFLLSIMLVLLLSVSQIRRVLVPIEELIAGNRRLAQRDFSTPVRVVSGDEFEELADSLNNMGRRLELQFTTLAALSHIDRLIIARSETAPILEALLGQLIDRFDADSAAVVVFDRNTSHQARSHTLKRGDAPHEIREERLVVSAPERSLLFLHDQGFAVRLDERTMPALDVLGEHGHDAAFVFPVIFDDKLYGALALGFDDHEQSDSVDRSAVRDFAGRLAVAFRARDRERELYHRAHYDDLTKLPNRQLFGDRLQREIVHARRAKSLVAVLFLDVDRFKHANDTLGHSFGDELLRRIAERLTSSVRETDTVARLGGDEFTIVLVGAATPTKVVNLARAIPKRLAQPFFIDGREYFTSTSLGVAFYPQDGSTAAEL